MNQQVKNLSCSVMANPRLNLGLSNGLLKSEPQKPYLSFYKSAAHRAPWYYKKLCRAETDACAVRTSLVAPSVMKHEIIIRPDYQRKSTAKYVLNPDNDRNRSLVSQKHRLPLGLRYLFLCSIYSANLNQKSPYASYAPFPLWRASFTVSCSFVTDEMLYEFRHIKLAHTPSPGSQVSAITPIDSHCQRFKMW